MRDIIMSPRGARSTGSIAVAIPACNEAAYIGRCLAALDRQLECRVDDIVVLVNNSTDGTAEVARRIALGSGAALHVLECSLPPGHAHAGNARRVAMEEAAQCVRGDGVLLTTDADGVVDPEWLRANLAALQAGADVVAGWVDLDPVDWARIPMKLHEDDAREMAYDAFCDEIHATLDPDPDDPLPRHTQHSGASIAVTLAAYRQSGGVPPLPSGEDRAFLKALRRIDSRIRHAPECHVTVSGRITGRAVGGMADTIRRRMVAQDRYIDARLEPAEDCARRATMRRRLRICRQEPHLLADLARDLRVDGAGLAEDLMRLPFGRTWEAMEAASPVLQARRVAVCDLERETRRAEALCATLRGRAAPAMLAAAAAPWDQGFGRHHV
jgi:hypothetical protein